MAVGRLVAVGDIHGNLEKLVRLLERISPTCSDRLVFLGDYIDRGEDSYGVVERLLQLKREFPETIILSGNHEDYIKSRFLGNINAKEAQLWKTQNGGLATLRSYEEAGEYLAVHQEFYLGLPYCFQTEEYFFCHAGIRPGIPLALQKDVDLVSIREPFLSCEMQYEKVIVHGHSFGREAVLLPNRICVDTGASGGGPLTAVELPSRRLYQVF